MATKWNPYAIPNGKDYNGINGISNGKQWELTK